MSHPLKSDTHAPHDPKPAWREITLHVIHCRSVPVRANCTSERATARATAQAISEPPSLPSLLPRFGPGQLSSDQRPPTSHERPATAPCFGGPVQDTSVPSQTDDLWRRCVQLPSSRLALSSTHFPPALLHKLRGDGPNTSRWWATCEGKRVKKHIGTRGQGPVLRLGRLAT